MIKIFSTVLLISNVVYAYTSSKNELQDICNTEEWSVVDLKHVRLSDYDNMKVDSCAVSLRNLPKGILTEKIVDLLSKTNTKMIEISDDLIAADENLFTLFFHLEYLSLAGNNLDKSNITNWDGRFSKKIEMLDLSRNRLSNLKFLKTESIKMKKIKLDGNLFREFPEELENYPYLVNISIAWNSLKTFPKEMSKLPDVTYFDANHNSLHDLGEIKIFPNLVHLILDGNSIEVLALRDMFDMPNLEILSLKNNRLRKIIPFSHKDNVETHLEFFDLEGNNLDDLPYNFLKYFPTLRTLKLNNNKLDILRQGTFSNLNNLQILDISNNQLTKLDDARFIPLQSLTILNIGGNKLKSIDHTSLLLNVPTLKNISFVGNPINCINAREILTYYKLENVNIAREHSCSPNASIEGICCIETDTDSSNNISSYSNKLDLRIISLEHITLQELQILVQKQDELNKLCMNVVQEMKDSNTLYVTKTQFWIGIIILIFVICIFELFKFLCLRQRMSEDTGPGSEAMLPLAHKKA